MANKEIQNITWTDGVTYDLTSKYGNRFYNNAVGTATITTSGKRHCAIWDITDENITELYDGLRLIVEVPVAGGSYGTGIRINSDTNSDIHPVVYDVNSAIGTRYAAGSLVEITYNSTQAGSLNLGSNTATNVTGVWQVMDYDVNYPNYQLRINNGTYLAYGANVTRYKLLFEYSPTQLVALTTGNGTSGHTYVDTDFNPFGPIFVLNNSGTGNPIFANNNAITASQCYNQLNVTITYTFNGNITNNKSVFLKCLPQTNNRAKLDTTLTTPLVQDLPTTEDGYIYIYLGHASATTALDLRYEHPIYQFKNGKVCLWTGNDSGGTVTGYWANQAISDTSSTATTPTFAKATISPTATTSGSALVINSSYSSPSIEFTGASNNAGTVILTKPSGMSSTDSATVTLPNTTGVLALTSDLPTDYVVSGTDTYLKSASVSGNTLTLTYGNNTTKNFAYVTYENKTAASGGTDLSLVTTGEKYTWNNKGTGTITGVSVNGTSVATSGVANITSVPWSIISSKPSIPNNSSTSAVTVANATTNNGFYYISSGGTYTPPFKQVDGATGSDYRVITNYYSTSWWQQIATDFRSNDIFIRRSQNGSVQPWTPIVKLQPCTGTTTQTMPTITDNAIARFDTTRNATIQNSSVTISDNGNIGGASSIDLVASETDTLTLSASTDSAGTLEIYSSDLDSSIKLNGEEQIISFGTKFYQFPTTSNNGTIALTSQIPTVTDYYWANVKVSSGSSTTTTPTFGQVTINPSSGAGKLTLKGASGYASGGITLQTPGTGSTTAYTLTLPAETSTLATQNYVSTAIANAITTALNTAV